MLYKFHSKVDNFISCHPHYDVFKIGELCNEIGNYYHPKDCAIHTPGAECRKGDDDKYTCACEGDSQLYQDCCQFQPSKLVFS